MQILSFSVLQPLPTKKLQRSRPLHVVSHFMSFLYIQFAYIKNCSLQEAEDTASLQPLSS
jgi:hypothetical protein